jgi:hypothetical protein
MAIYHCNVRHIKSPNNSGGGRRLAAQCKYDYLARENKRRAKNGQLSFIASGNLPAWVGENPREYWSGADRHERANARLATHLEFALPKEANIEEQIQIAQDFVNKITKTSDGRSLPYSLAIHQNKGNPHCHVMISDRGNDGLYREAPVWFSRAATGAKSIADGGAAKVRELKSKDWLFSTRAKLEVTLNEFLIKKNLPTVSAKTLKAQGIERQAQIHFSPVAAAIEKRRDIKTDKGELWRAHNEIIRIESELKDFPLESTPKIEIPRPKPVDLKAAREKELKDAHAGLEQKRFSIQAQVERKTKELASLYLEIPPPRKPDKLLEAQEAYALATQHEEKAKEELTLAYRDVRPDDYEKATGFLANPLTRRLVKDSIARVANFEKAKKRKIRAKKEVAEAGAKLRAVEEPYSAELENYQKESDARKEHREQIKAALDVLNEELRVAKRAEQSAYDTWWAEVCVNLGLVPPGVEDTSNNYKHVGPTDRTNWAPYRVPAAKPEETHEQLINRIVGERAKPKRMTPAEQKAYWQEQLEEGRRIMQMELDPTPEPKREQARPTPVLEASVQVEVKSEEIKPGVEPEIKPEVKPKKGRGGGMSM